MFCPKCGTKNDEDALFCQNCGNRLVLPVPSPVAEAVPEPASEIAAPEPAPVISASEHAAAAEEASEPAPVIQAESVSVQSSGTAPEAASVNAAPEPAPVNAVSEPAPVAMDAEVSAASPEVTSEAVSTEAVPVAEALTEEVSVPAPAIRSEDVSAPAVRPEAVTVPDAPETVVPEKKIKKRRLFAGKEAKQPEGEVKKRSKLPLIGVCAGVVICIVVAAIIFFGRLAGSSADVVDSITYFYAPQDDCTYIVHNGNVLTNWFEGHASILGYDGKRDKALISCDSDLYLVDSKENLKLVAEDVKFADISYDGNMIAYVDNDDSLYAYSVKNGKVSYISGDNTVAPVLSPKGSAIAYVCEEDGDGVMYVYTGKKSFRLGRDVMPLALSDNAKYIYYYDPEKNALYCCDKKYNTNKLGTDIYSSCTFNKDLSQIIFSDENGVYYAEKGGEKQRIFDRGISVFPLQNTIYTASTVRSESSYNIFATQISNTLLGGSFYTTSNNEVLYISPAMTVNKLVGNSNEVSVANKGKAIYYITTDNTLYYAKLTPELNSVKVADDVYTVQGASRSNSGYYMDNDKAIYSLNGARKGKKIADDVYNFQVSSDGICYYMCNFDPAKYRSDLYAFKSGISGKQFICDDCAAVFSYAGMVLYYGGYDMEYQTYELYSTPKGIKFNHIIIGII